LKQLEYTDIRLSGFAANNYPACGGCTISSANKKQVCVFVSQKLPDAFGTGQTCLLRPLVAKGFKTD